jgi:hypothetical protein
VKKRYRLKLSPEELKEDGYTEPPQVVKDFFAALRRKGQQTSSNHSSKSSESGGRPKKGP